MDILFAENSKKETIQLKPETIKDLGLNEVLENITEGEKEMLIVKDIITKIPSDIADIRYRQEIMKDFLDNEELTQSFSEAIWQIKTLKDYSNSLSLTLQKDNSLYVLLEYLRELTYLLDRQNDSNGEHKYSVIKIKCPKNIKFYKDLDYPFGVFTKENISPDYIEEINDIEPLSFIELLNKNLK